MLAHTIFVQLQSLVDISTHADRQSVDMSITVCLFVNLSLCTVTDFSAGDKASGVKFCTMVHGRPEHGISHFGYLCSHRSPKFDESAPVLKICSFQKRAPYQRGRCPDTLDIPWIRPWLFRNYTGFKSLTASSTNTAYWFTNQWSGTHRRTILIYWSRSQKSPLERLLMVTWQFRDQDWQGLPLTDPRDAVAQRMLNIRYRIMW